MQRTWLVLAILGAVIPWGFFLPWLLANGIDLRGFLAALFVNGAAGGAFADLLVSSVVFWVWMFSRRAGPKPWLFIAINLGIGLSCALPAYLYATERSRS